MQEVRTPAVAGTFYAAEATALSRQIAWCTDHSLGPRSRIENSLGSGAGLADLHLPLPTPVRAVICPHAGYRYSGPIAAHAYDAIARSGVPDLVAIVGPNHQMLGAQVATAGHRAWQTPFGPVAIDVDAVALLCATCPSVVIDDLAHSLEHSVEVQVPFVQHLLGGRCLLLPVVTYQHDLKRSRDLGLALANVLRDRSAVVVASSDFTHYEGHESAKRKDSFALEAIEALDVVALMRAIERHRISLCGPGAIIAAMTASQELGAQAGHTLRYATSGELSGDYGHVVGYAAVAFG